MSRFRRMTCLVCGRRFRHRAWERAGRPEVTLFPFGRMLLCSRVCAETAPRGTPGHEAVFWIPGEGFRRL